MRVYASTQVRVNLRSKIAAVWVCTLILAVGPAFGDSGAFSSTKHGDSNTGVLRDAAIPRGNCAQCHNQHGGAFGSNDFGLFALNYGGNKNGVCYSSGCHADAGIVGVYQGRNSYSISIHNLSGSCYWPGANPPARPNSDAGNCANCHNPHGFKDGVGLIPSLAIAREEALCVTCHDSNGPALKDVGYQLTKTYDHYIDNGSYAGRHSAAETTTPSNYSGANRHVECTDCHNVHRIPSTTTHTTGTNAASDLLKGVSWIEVSYGTTPWITPMFTARSANYTADIRYEYELCFKCHSWWAYNAAPPLAPSGGTETDQSIEFNPNNKSYHPVVSPVQNNSYTRPSAVNGFTETMVGQWATGSGHHTMYCSDCHTDDASNAPKGPHGSNSLYLLIGSTSDSDNTLCLKCHSSAVYAPSTDPGSTETGSRFDRQTTGRSGASHYFHVQGKGIGCRRCHGGRQTPSPSAAAAVQPGSIHGTDSLFGFMNGTHISAYSPGSCTPASGGNCHGNKTYTAGAE